MVMMGMTENKRFNIEFDGHQYFLVVDVPNERCVGRFDTMGDAKGYLELYEYFIDVEEELQKLKKENEQLKKEVEELKLDLKMARIDGAIDRMAQRPMKW